MITKFYIHNGDLMRESDKAVLLRVGFDKYVWIEKQYIEQFNMISRSKVYIPDNIQWKVLTSYLHHIPTYGKQDEFMTYKFINSYNLKKLYMDFNAMNGNPLKG